MAPDGIELSVVIPAHNSSSLIEQTVQRLADRLAGLRAEMIIVENGSTDDTLARCERLAAQWPRSDVSLCVLQSAKGMGHALRAGAMISRGDRVLLTADDLPFGFDDLDAADRLVRSGRAVPEAIVGSKAHPDSVIGRGATRGVLTGGFGLLRRLVLGTKVGDSQGTLLLDGGLLRRLLPETREGGFLFSTELIYLMEQAGIRPHEVPVRLSEDHAGHESRINLSDIASMAIGLLRLRRRHRGRALASVGSSPSQ